MMSLKKKRTQGKPDFRGFKIHVHHVRGDCVQVQLQFVDHYSGRVGLRCDVIDGDVGEFGKRQEGVDVGEDDLVRLGGGG